MQEFQTFNPSSFGQLGAGLFYYLILIVCTFIALGTIYVLIKNGRTRALSFAVCVVFGMIFLALASDGVRILNSIQ